jgi:hypothetical protein
MPIPIITTQPAAHNQFITKFTVSPPNLQSQTPSKPLWQSSAKFTIVVPLLCARSSSATPTQASTTYHKPPQPSIQSCCKQKSQARDHLTISSIVHTKLKPNRRLQSQSTINLNHHQAHQTRPPLHHRAQPWASILITINWVNSEHLIALCTHQSMEAPKPAPHHSPDDAVSSIPA